MHPFCCVSTVSDHSPAKHSATALLDIHSMPPLPAATSARSDPNNNNNHNTNGECGRLSQSRATASVASQSAREQPVDVKINDIVGNGISGILYKWVNYGKGWRPRWFVLLDGVLSYYKIHGPDKIVVNQETEKGSKVIGEESLRRISRRSRASLPQQNLPRKPFGEIHLKVFHQSHSHFFFFFFNFGFHFLF
jgi:hypothetical protein